MMPTMTLDSVPEQRAAAATDLQVFNKINLVGIKDSVGQLLKLIGTSGLFQEYTVHDITHVESMLALADELTPASTQDRMTGADWLLIVLAIYFHDMGLLVSHDEYEARGNSGFAEYCETNFFGGDDGAEYKSQIDGMGSDAAERFLYQEFVRANHATRIGDWIRGRHNPLLGVATDAVQTLNELLAGLSSVFRDDLAVVCESHHLNDLDDVAKYPIRQPYDNVPEATANVQYAAIILRSADLLHITSDRTPSIAFRFINPQNPLSQREWAKQKAVRSVQPQLGTDEDGNLSETAERNTLAVFAVFDDADGFFGLMSYLRFAREQLQQSYEWARASQAQQAAVHEFPWRRVDDSQISTKGFLPKQLAFTLDQSRILELLTGHMLYNDSRVVARELLQNALDAVRLQTLIDKRPDEDGVVTVEWSDDTRELVVRDNGTGMTQTVIENNLLKAGASRYQEETFVERHPSFSPISKFGIGVLSAFMVANEVEIITASPDEDIATRLKLRSVHDRYLVSLLDKTTDPDAQRIGPHGTEVRIRVRDTTEFPDVLSTVRYWAVVPRCTVTVSVNGEDPEPVGFASCARAVETTLVSLGAELYKGTGEPSSGLIRVVSENAGGVETAFAVTWSSAFSEWSISRFDRLGLARAAPGADLQMAIGACIEGIRVEDGSPGFTSPGIVGLCNAVGNSAPKTNVARSGLEQTPARAAMMRHVYDAYIGQVAGELHELTSERGFSSTWAAQEAEYMLRPFVVDPRQGLEQSAHMEPLALRSALAAKPLVVVEDTKGRRLASGAELDAEPRLWTVDSAFVRAGESLLREVPNDSSLGDLARTLGTDTVTLPEGTTLVGFRAYSSIWSFLLSGREIGHVVIRRAQRRLDLGWDHDEAGPHWVSLAAETGRFANSGAIVVASENPTIDGRDEEVAVRSHGRLFLFADSPIAEFARQVAEDTPETATGRQTVGSVAICISRYLGLSRHPDDTLRWVEMVIEQETVRERPVAAGIYDTIDLEKFVAALRDTRLRVFDTNAWRREQD